MMIDTSLIISKVTGTSTFKTDRNIQFFFGGGGISSDPGGRAVLGVSLRPLACWDYGFECRQSYVCLLCVLRVVKSLRRADHS